MDYLFGSIGTIRDSRVRNRLGWDHCVLSYRSLRLHLGKMLQLRDVLSLLAFTYFTELLATPVTTKDFIFPDSKQGWYTYNTESQTIILYTLALIMLQSIISLD